MISPTIASTDIIRRATCIARRNWADTDPEQT